VFVPASNRVAEDGEIRRMVAAIGAAQLITTGGDGYPRATLLPVIWSGDVVLAHMARANAHWKEIADGSPSPGWYASKADDGKVVPTWNYSSVQLRGSVRVHHDPEWLRAQVTTLTDRHEHERAEPWHVTDAPPAFVEGQLRGIVGIELDVEQVDAKAKLSQNRSAQDQDGVIDGLAHETGAEAMAVAEAMRALRPTA
jgi:transcriptional regulator